MEHIFGDPVGEIESIIDEMRNIVYVEGVGRCRVITINRTNENGVNEPYDVYEPIEEKSITWDGKQKGVDAVSLTYTGRI